MYNEYLNVSALADLDADAALCATAAEVAEDALCAPHVHCFECVGYPVRCSAYVDELEAHGVAEDAARNAATLAACFRNRLEMAGVSPAIISEYV